jgi:hypothetical protein
MERIEIESLRLLYPELTDELVGFRPLVLSRRAKL